ncbi:MAG: 2Fe-2S iron-sulfur cluster binding domain-containing protein [Immundisolibacteraceae bacterium]|nr:2Fe-2S iron-sulfur cluster binding domain-containing protein [Immundisolibacteraceae bacterium]
MVFGLFGKHKGPAKAEISPFQQTIEVQKNESLLQAALAAGIDFPHSCKVGTCVQCRCKLTEGKVKAIRDFSYVLSVEELQAGYILACQARVKPGEHIRVDVELETGRPKFEKQQFSAVVESVETLTHDIKALTLKTPSKLEYVAGQYAELSLPEIDRPREYSFAAAAEPGGSDRLLFYIRHVPGGVFTDWLFSADRTGESVQINAPTGNFWLRESEQPLLLVGGGSGLAPLKAIIEDALQRHVKRDLVFLFGARSQRDLYAMDELAALGRSWQGQFEIIPVLSDEPSDSGWQGRQGFVHTVIKADVVSDLNNRHAYLCGPPVMIDAAIEVMNAVGIHGDHIHYDKFLDASNLAPG